MYHKSMHSERERLPCLELREHRKKKKTLNFDDRDSDLVLFFFFFIRAKCFLIVRCSITPWQHLFSAVELQTLSAGALHDAC